MLGETRPGENMFTKLFILLLILKPTTVMFLAKQRPPEDTRRLTAVGFLPCCRTPGLSDTPTFTFTFSHLADA